MLYCRISSLKLLHIQSILNPSICVLCSTAMSYDMVEDRVYRILNAPAQNMIDYWALLCGTFGLIFSQFVYKYNPMYDPFIHRSMLEKVIVQSKRRALQLGDEGRVIDDEIRRNMKFGKKRNYRNVYKNVFSFCWMNNRVRHQMSFIFIGVGVGCLFHFVRTRNVVSCRKIWQYTTNCMGT